MALDDLRVGSEWYTVIAESTEEIMLTDLSDVKRIKF